jgi:hypothetical protein
MTLAMLVVVTFAAIARRSWEISGRLLSLKYGSFVLR